MTGLLVAARTAAAPAVPVGEPPAVELLGEPVWLGDVEAEVAGAGDAGGAPAGRGEDGAAELPAAGDVEGDEADGADGVCAGPLVGADPVEVVLGDPDVGEADDPDPSPRTRET